MFLVFGPIQNVEPTYFDAIDADMIDRAIKTTSESAGPSNMESYFFKELCHKSFKKEGDNLKTKIASLARKLAYENVNPNIFKALLRAGWFH